jgi:hypothetical protein
MKWQEITGKSVVEAYDPDNDPMYGYVRTMYDDLLDGHFDMTVLHLRDYIYDAGTPANLARSIVEIEPRFVDLIKKNKPGIIKIMAEIASQFDDPKRILLPVFDVLHSLKIDWPEIDIISKRLKSNQY